MKPALAKSLESVAAAHTTLRLARTIGPDQADEALVRLGEEVFSLLVALLGYEDANKAIHNLVDGIGDNDDESEVYERPIEVELPGEPVEEITFVVWHGKTARLGEVLDLDENAREWLDAMFAKRRPQS